MEEVIRQPMQIIADCHWVLINSQKPNANFAELKERIDSLFQEVIKMNGYPQASTLLAQATINCNRRRDQRVDAEESTFFHRGTINQFNISPSETSSACTNIVQYFLTQVLFLRHPASIDHTFIDECIREGTRNHEYWIHINQLAHKADGVELK